MSYDNGNIVTHRMPAITSVTAAATYAIRGPKGKTGRLVDVIATCTTTHVLGSSTVTALLIGKSGDTDAYGTFTPPALTAATGVSTLGDAPGLSVPPVSGHVIAADSQVLLTTVANSGGSAAGVLLYDVLIDWS